MFLPASNARFINSVCLFAPAGFSRLPPQMQTDNFALLRQASQPFKPFLTGSAASCASSAAVVIK